MRVDRLIGTDFLVDRWRNGESSDASAYARAHLDDSLAISWIVKAEFLVLAGIVGQDSRRIAGFLGRYPTQWPDEELLADYARLDLLLGARGLSLHANDLWLAASALRLDVPLVTRNTGSFGNVPGIKLDPF